MNYIIRLQEENEALRQSVEDAKAEIIAFRAYLSSEKFNSGCGNELDRYVNISDCMNWLANIHGMLI